MFSSKESSEEEENEAATNIGVSERTKKMIKDYCWPIVTVVDKRVESIYGIVNNLPYVVSCYTNCWRTPDWKMIKD